MPFEVERRALLRAGALGTAAMMGGMAPLQALAASRPDTWQLLFNGVDLTGWTFFQEGVGQTDKLGAVAIDDGVLHLLGPHYQRSPGGGFGRLTTQQRYADYHLRLDFRWGIERFAPRTLAKRNSGILYHMAPDLDVLYPDCIEFQMEESDVGDAILVNTIGLEGANLGGTPVWPAYPPFLPRTYTPPVVAGGIARQWFKKTGDFELPDAWNTLDLIAFGDQAAHLVNGRIVTTLFGLRQRPVPRAAPAPLTGGRIALELEGAEVMFRNVMIRQLSPGDIAELRRG